jgi:hypothetical protein
MRPSITSWVTAFLFLTVRFGRSHASVTALSMMCFWTLLHLGQENVRKSWPTLLGSIAESFIGEPQAVHCGPWFCPSSMSVSSVRRPEFAVKPSEGVGLERVRRNDADLDVIAFRAFEQPVFEADRPRRNAFEHHSRSTAWTARALDTDQELLGWGHDASLHWAGALSNSRLPVNAVAGR